MLLAGPSGIQLAPFKTELWKSHEKNSKLERRMEFVVGFQDGKC